jgi:hypothetical protein
VVEEVRKPRPVDRVEPPVFSLPRLEGVCPTGQAPEKAERDSGGGAPVGGEGDEGDEEEELVVFVFVLCFCGWGW